MIKLQAKIGMPKQDATYAASQTITEIHWDLGGFDTVDRFSHEFNWKQWISHEFSGDFSSCSSIGWNAFSGWCLEPLGTKSGPELTSDGCHLEQSQASRMNKDDVWAIR